MVEAGGGMSIARDIDPWVHPQIGRGAHGDSQIAEGAAAGPSAEFSFWDLLDVINPLQHIPVVSSIYRKVTGDEITVHARIMGATLYGGPVGFVVATNLAVAEEAAGRRIEDVVADALFGDSDTEDLADAGAAKPADKVAVAAVMPAGQPDGSVEALAAVPDIESDGSAEPPADAPGAAPDPASSATPVPETLESLPIAPAAQGTVLSGEDALRAFAEDMHSLGSGAMALTPVPTGPAIPAPAVPIPPWPNAVLPVEIAGSEEEESDASQEEQAGLDQAQADFSRKMMDGLRKYDLMSRTASGVSGTPSPMLLDNL
jgi:hypothetical protein